MDGATRRRGGNGWFVLAGALLALALGQVGDAGAGEHALKCGLGVPPHHRRSALVLLVAVTRGTGGHAHRTVERLHHVEHADVLRAAREGETPAGAAVTAEHPAAAQRPEELLEELRRQVTLAGQVGDAHRARLATGAKRELHEGSDCIAALG